MTESSKQREDVSVSPLFASERKSGQARAILFDLDGTLLDTVHDIAAALHKLCQRHQYPLLPLATVRSRVNLGTGALLQAALGMEVQEQDYPALWAEFLGYYQERQYCLSHPFPYVEQLLADLDRYAIPWGVVTNRHVQAATDVLAARALLPRARCVVGGDTLPRCKPFADPLLHACQLLQEIPQQVVYLGDAKGDVIASRAAGCIALVALYGYIGETDPKTWQADGYVAQPLDVLPWLAYQQTAD